MVFAVVIDLVRKTLRESAVLALGRRRVALGTLLAHFLDEPVERFVLESPLIVVNTVRTLLPSLVKTFLLDKLCVILVDTKTVNTLLVVSVLAARLRVHFVSHYFLPDIARGSYIDRDFWLSRTLARRVNYTGLGFLYLGSGHRRVLIANVDDVAIFQAELG